MKKITRFTHNKNTSQCGKILMPKKETKAQCSSFIVYFHFLASFCNVFCVHSARCSGVFWNNFFFYCKETANGGLVDLCIAGVCVLLLFFFHSFSNLYFERVHKIVCVHRRHVSNKAASTESGIVLNMYHVFQHVLSIFLNAYVHNTHTHTDSTKTNKSIHCQWGPVHLYIVQQKNG